MDCRIAVIQGHPDPDPLRFGRQLSDAYLQGASEGGHAARLVDVATLEFPLLRSQSDWQNAQAPETLQAAQDALAWADHWVLFYPLWLGAMPARLKGFLEQTLRPGFALDYGKTGGLPKKLLKGKSARIVVTMGMPAFFYRWYFRAHSLKNLERNILRFCGVAPVHETLIGGVEGMSDAGRQRRIDTLRMLGRRAR